MKTKTWLSQNGLKWTEWVMEKHSSIIKGMKVWRGERKQLRCMKISLLGLINSTCYAYIIYFVPILYEAFDKRYHTSSQLSIYLFTKIQHVTLCNSPGKVAITCTELQYNSNAHENNTHKKKSVKRLMPAVYSNRKRIIAAAMLRWNFLQGCIAR